MIKLQTKEYSNTRKNAGKGSAAFINKAPSIKDLSLGQKQETTKTGQKVPNMDLIEDVSHAS